MVNATGVAVRSFGHQLSPAVDSAFAPRPGHASGQEFDSSTALIWIKFERSQENEDLCPILCMNAVKQKRIVGTKMRFVCLELLSLV